VFFNEVGDCINAVHKQAMGFVDDEEFKKSGLLRFVPELRSVNWRAILPIVLLHLKI